jgi:hypothetical protein
VVETIPPPSVQSEAEAAPDAKGGIRAGSPDPLSPVKLSGKPSPCYNLWVTQILKIAAGASSEDDELDFEQAYQRSLTTAQRFEMMQARSRQIAEELIRRGHRRPVEIVKRP